MLRTKQKPGVRYAHNSSFKAKPSKMKRSRLERSGKPMKRGAPMKKKREPPALIKAKREVRERDNYTCQHPGCGYQAKSIDVHHRMKISQRPDLKFDPNNMLCLCRKHHRDTDLKRKEAEALGLVGGPSYELAKKQEREAA